MRRAFGLASILFVFSVCSSAQPPIAFELKEAKFGLNAQSFADVGPCNEDDMPSISPCPPDYDCRKTPNFRVAIDNKSGGASDQRRFYVAPLNPSGETKCWKARLEPNLTNRNSAFGSARFVVSQGSLREEGAIPIFVEGESALTLAKSCSNWTLVLGSTGSCQLSIAWSHPVHGGHLVGCTWTGESQTLEKIDGCAAPSDAAFLDRLRRDPRSGPDSWRNLRPGDKVDINLQPNLPWSKWRAAFQDPMEEQTRKISVTAYYRFSEGGPLLKKEFSEIPFQVVTPFFMLILFLIAGSTVGSALPLAAAFAQKKPVKFTAWARTSIALAVYGLAVWLILYFVKGRVGLMQTELRLNQAIPVLLFGLFIGFRGLAFVVDWIERIVTPNSGTPTGILMLTLFLGTSVQAAAPSANNVPKQLLVAGGRLLLVTDCGVHQLDDSTAANVQQRQIQKSLPDHNQLIEFARGALAGAAASGAVLMPGGATRELIFISLSLPGGQVLIDEYLPDGSQKENRILDLRRRPFDFTAPPTALAWDATAQRLYASSQQGTIWSIPRDGPPQRLTATKARVSSFALDENGRRLFVADVQGGQVLLLDLRRPAAGLTPFANDAPLSDPWALAFDGNSSRLFVADEHRDAVFSIKVPPPPARPLNVKWSSFVSKSHSFLRGYGFGDPVAITIYKKRIWIADRESRRVFPVDISTVREDHPYALP